MLHKTIITSRDNERVKFAKRVRDGREPSVIFLEGKRLVVEALKRNVRIISCLVSSEFPDQSVLDLLKDHSIDPLTVTRAIFDSICDTAGSQGIAAIAERPHCSMADLRQAASAVLPIYLYLYEVNNPSNLGAVLRTAEAAGVTALITSPNSADAFSAKANRAALGANLRLAVCEGVTFANALAWALSNGITVTASAASADKQHCEIDWMRPRLLVLGSEAHGLPADILSAAEESVCIEMENEVESLNLAVSVGIILFEAKRQISG